MRRGQSPRVLGDLGPDCPAPLKTIALDIASTACSCFLGPVTTPTASVTVTRTAATTVTDVITSTVTVPATTYTETDVGTATSVDARTATATTLAPSFTVTGQGYCQCKYLVLENTYCPYNYDDGDFTGYTLKQCIDACDGEPGCEGVDYITSTGSCTLIELFFDTNYQEGAICAYRRSCVAACRL